MTRSISIVSGASAHQGESFTGLGAGRELRSHAPRTQQLGCFLPCPTCNRPSLVWHVAANGMSTVSCGACGADILGAV